MSEGYIISLGMLTSEVKYEAADHFVEIDGSTLEGGGQILRLCGALACLLKKPIRINKIRAKRSREGLRKQHVHCLQLINQIFKGELSGAELHSSTITYRPGNPTLTDAKEVAFSVDMKTAGSICLLMQIALPAMICLPTQSRLTMRGGTNASKAPMVDYYEMVFLPTLEKHLNISTALDIRKRGYFPRGGGEVVFSTYPVSFPLPAIQLEDRGNIVHVVGQVVVSGKLPKRLIIATKNAALETLRTCSPLREIPVDIEEVYRPEDDSAIYIILRAYSSTNCIIASSIVGEKSMKAEQLGKKSASLLVNTLNSGSCVDEYLMDQLVIFMALASGTSRVLTSPLSMHSKTAIHFAKLMTGAKFIVQESPKQNLVIVECEGISFCGSVCDSFGLHRQES